MGILLVIIALDINNSLSEAIYRYWYKNVLHPKIKTYHS